MSDEPNQRRYSEEEFALILQKVAEIREASPEPGGSGGDRGFSLEEIRTIASEAGIDPEAVSRAAALLGALEWEETKGLAGAIFGGAGTYHLSLDVEGGLPPEEIGRILEVIRHEVGNQGMAEEVLGGVEWKTVGQLSAINVNLSPRGDATSIQIVGERGAAGAVTFVFPMMGAGVLTGIVGAIVEPTTVQEIIGLVAGVMGGGFLFARGLWVSNGKRFHARLSRLIERLTGEVGRRTVPASSGAAEGTEEA